MKRSAMSQIDRIVRRFHRHKWKATHCNGWGTDTKQICSCGLSRQFEYPRPEIPIGVAIDRGIFLKGMPWDRGLWVWSNGSQTKFR